MIENTCGSSSELVRQIAELLIERGESLGVIESAAGGRICDLLTDRAGSSAWFAGGAIAYSNASKQALAGEDDGALAPASAVSAETAAWLAAVARRRFGATWGLGETGIAGPQSGRRSRKPAGLAFLAVCAPTGRSRVLQVETGHDNRGENKQTFAEVALQLLLEELRGAASADPAQRNS